MSQPEERAATRQDSRSLSAIVVTWNSAEHIGECLRSLREAWPSAQVIVVDNASRDRTVEVLRREFPDVCLIQNTGNLGYARANNQGIERSNGEYLLFMNPDTRMREGLEMMIDYLAAHAETGAISPQLLNSDLTIQQSCREFPTLTSLLWEFTGLSRLFPGGRWFGRWKMGYFDHRSQREVDQPMASCLLVPRRVCELVGRFDERFPMFMNDVDLCYRIKNANLSIVFFPDAKAIHLLGGSTRKAKARMILSSHWSIYRYFKKHHPSWLNEPLGAVLLVSALLRITFLRVRRFVLGPGE
jgi:GT2 family glycosyltransferase